MLRIPFLLLGLCVFCFIQGCGVSPKKAFDVHKVSYSTLPGWKKDDLTEAMPALLKNCEALGTRAEWKTFCDGIKRLKGRPSAQIRKFIESTMTPYAVYSYGSDKGTFTGYYEASLNGSLVKDDKNIYPIYGLPKDLVQLDTKTVCNEGGDTGMRIGRIDNAQFVPYLTRADMMSETYDAPVLLWVDSAVDAFILHIQGSGRIQTPDGVVHVGYAGNNGHEFVGIGSIMAQEGLLEEGKASMPEIKNWLQKNPKKAEELMKRNPRFIFFKILEKTDGPLGALGVPLTAKRSLAVDTRFIPLGSLLFLETTTPEGDDIRNLVVAQDKGGAIKGAVRGDYFWGYGEDAFINAGRMKSKGRYFLLYPKGQGVPTGF